MTIQEEIQNGESRTLEYKATLPQDSQNMDKNHCCLCKWCRRQVCSWCKQSTRVCRT